MRMIDADALEKWIADRVKNYHKSYSDWRETPPISVEMALMELDCIKEAVRESPTIDAAPVVHARWKTVKNSTYCSACNAFLPVISYTLYEPDDEWEYCEEIEKTRYCPYCGAKMDGGENDA